MTMQEKNLDKLLKVLEDIDVTEGEKNTIGWLSGWSVETVNNICSIMEKLKNTK